MPLKMLVSLPKPWLKMKPSILMDLDLYPPVENVKETVQQVTMANALAHSLNCASASIMKQVTPKQFVDFLKNINIKSNLEPYPSICLGAVEISLYEMMWGYTMFPSGGFSTKPYYIARIEDKNGNVLDRFDTERKEVISQNTAYTMCRMMQGTVDIGTAAGMRDRLGIAEMGGKTGTTKIIRMPGSWDILRSCWPVYGSDAMIILSGWTVNWEKAAVPPDRSGNIFMQKQLPIKMSD